MIFQRVTDMRDAAFEECWSIYTESFPEEERRDIREQEKIFARENYHFTTISEENAPLQILGILAFWVFPDSLFLEHLAAHPRRKGKGIGTAAIGYLQELSREKYRRPVVLEIEIPTDEISRRREHFYTRLGFSVAPYRHLQPPFHRNTAAVPMNILSWPHEISEKDYHRFYAEEKAIMPKFD